MIKIRKMIINRFFMKNLIKNQRAINIHKLILSFKSTIKSINIKEYLWINFLKKSLNNFFII